jgi:hypothetical protein
LGLFGQLGRLGPLRHEEDSTAVDLWQMCQITLDFLAVFQPVDDKLELALKLGRQLPDDLWCLSGSLVAL